MKRVVICLIALLVALPVMAVQLHQESFEATTGWSVSPAFATPATDDFMGRYTVATKPTGLAVLLGGLDGDYFIAGEDCNGTAPLPSDAIYTVTLDAVDVSGYSNLAVSIALNAKNNATYDTWNLSNGDYLHVYRNVDNTGDVLIARFTKVGPSGSNGYLGQDTDLDGLGDVEIPDYNNFNHYTFDVGATGSSLVVKVVTRFESGNEEFAYDNIRVNGDLGGVNETDAHLFGCVGGLATISSLVDTQPEEQIVLHFETQDAGTGGQFLNTIINGIVIGQGDANTVGNWTYVIAGAELYELTLGGPWVGTVNSSNIVFSGSPMATMPDGGPVFEWDLYIWLRTDLPYWADNEILEFNVGPVSFVTDPTGAGFDLSDPPCESGDLNNRIDIVATKLDIVTQPPATACKDQNFTLWVGFTDVNGGVDEDFPSENITLSVNTGTGTLSAASGLTKASTNGESGWNDLRYSVAETGVILQATSVTYPTPVLTNAFDVITCPTIAIDAYPLCWDGNNTDAAVPFVVHISVRDWTDAAGQDVYMKVYSGSYNPFHYTDTYGWSSLTNWDRKPIVTIDANGNWSGWLALKSAGMATFQPRAALVSNTSTRVTGDPITGTLLDLTTTGVVVEDTDGVRSWGTPGNIILVRGGGGGGGAILGSWIIEDNGYPLDDGGITIASGGWRLAMCDVCEDVTFESWDPQYWPGHGVASFFDIVEDFCPTPGSVVEMDDVQLPVELLSFTATAGDRRVRLSWATASETDNDYFLVERNGETAARVESHGNSASGGQYSWTDEGLDNGATYRYTLISVSLTGDRAELQTVEATPSENAAATITEYALHQNYPNPFNPATQIAFDLVESGVVSLKVYNLMGQAVATLVNGAMPAGAHAVSFDAANLPSGLYLYRIEVNGFTAEKKMLLMK